jgi:hypothetical protein
MFLPILDDLVSHAREQVTLERVLPCVRAMKLLCTAGTPAKAASHPFCALVLTHPLFLPEAGRGIDLETRSLLGPFFRPTAIPELQVVSVCGVCVCVCVCACVCERGVEVRQSSLTSTPQQERRGGAGLRTTYTGEAYFQVQDAQINAGAVEVGRQTLRQTLHILQSDLTEIVKALLRLPEDRDTVMGYFMQALRVNRKRSQLAAQLDHGAPDTGVSTHGFMMNITVVLLRVCVCVCVCAKV